MSVSLALGLSVFALLLAAAALWLAWRSRRQLLHDLRELECTAEQREQESQQRLLDLGEHALTLERRLNRISDQYLMQRANSGADSVQEQQLRAVSDADAPEGEAEARLRALLARRDRS